MSGLGRLTWILHAIAASPLQGKLVFKGGTAINKMYVSEYRFSEDLDFTILDSETTNDSLESATESQFPWLRQETNLVLAIRRVDVHSSGNRGRQNKCANGLS